VPDGTGVFVPSCALPPCGAGVGCAPGRRREVDVGRTAHINEDNEAVRKERGAADGETRREGSDAQDEPGTWAWTVDWGGEPGWVREVDEMPWRPVTPGEAAGLLAAYRQAHAAAEELTDALVKAGVDPVAFDGMCPSVDASGRPVVILGRVSTRTAQHLCAVLNPPRAA